MSVPGDLPTFQVLLATHNSERWLGEQLASIAAQTGVLASVVASDDSSIDRTRELLSVAIPGLNIQQLPASNRRLGSANRNFLRLIRDTPMSTAQYFALSDHDDVWLPTKLERAVTELTRTGCDVYSSSVTAFWENGRERLLDKSKPQRRYDHLFESAGPGCTFVFTRESFLNLRAWIGNNFDTLQNVKVHDWLIYAYARQQGWRWLIDAQSCTRYRQHANNEVGANRGMRARLVRLRQVCSGQYRHDILAVAAATGDRSSIVGALERFTLLDRLWLAARCRDCRRDPVDALLLGLFFLMMPRH